MSHGPSDAEIAATMARLSLAPVAPGETVSLGHRAARLADAPPKAALQAATQILLDRLTALQDAFHADRRTAVLLVLQGRDASGKDGVIRTVCGAFNPGGVQVASFGPPTERELGHDYLWRVHQVIPPRGVIGVFNRSHYEDVLVVRVRGLVPESRWRQRYAQINAFEQLLAENDVVIRKCFLHVSRDEQKARLQERLDDPTKNWKFRLGDLDDRAKWDDYTAAYQDVLARCSTPWAPWYVVPSDSKTMRNFLIAKLLVETIEALQPTYPPMDPAVREAARGFQ